ncbi:MAG: hypothetical protein V7K27_27475 [Nostoc sp.]
MNKKLGICHLSFVIGHWVLVLSEVEVLAKQGNSILDFGLTILD